jgi:hypothetical protein
MSLLRIGIGCTQLAASLAAIGIAVPAAGERIVFAWSGTVSSVDPDFAAALPADSGVIPGADAFVRFEFESTTPDQDPSESAGDYVGAITSFALRAGSLIFVQRIDAPANTIVIVSDPLFGFYEPLTTVDPSTPIAGFQDLKGDVFFIPISTQQIPDDSLLLTIPDPVEWSTAASGVLDPAGAVLLDVRLDATALPEPDPRLALIGGSALLVALNRRRRYAPAQRRALRAADPGRR